MRESKLTAPNNFQIQSDERGVSKSPASANAPPDLAPDATVANSVDTLRFASPWGSPKGSPRSNGKQRVSRLTVPQAPRFQTDERAAARPDEHSNETYVPMAQSNEVLKKGLRDSKGDAVGERWEKKLTVPHAPRFQSDERAAAKPAEHSNETYVPLAQSTDVLMKGLRGGDSSDSAEHDNWGEQHRLTVPHAPKLHQIHARAMPKSADELQEEEMEYFRTHGFKARPLPAKSSTASPTISPNATRKATAPHPFHFKSDERAAAAKPLEPTVTQEDMDLEECKKKFHALPMPKFVHPVQLSPEVKVKKSVPKVQEPPKAFRARPVPKSTYASPPPSLHNANSTDTPSPGELVEKEVEATPVPAKPFVLESAVRHEEYQKKLAEKLRQEELEEKRKSEFHARPFKKTNTPPSIKPVKKTANRSPSPSFELQSSSRHKAAEEELKRKLAEAEVEQKRQTVFKAKPLPKAIYKEYTERHLTPEQKRKKKAAVPRMAAGVPPVDRGAPSSSGDPAPTSFMSTFLLFFMICLLRIANTFLVQSYFDPDEFWQTMEPAYCQVFDGSPDCPGYTWEWKRRPPPSADNLIDQSLQGPARSYISVLPTYLFFSVLKRYELDTYWLVSRGPMLLGAVTAAAPTDLAVWYAARWLKPLQSTNRTNVLPAWCLFCSLSAWFNAYASTRTFANCQETALLAIAVALVSPELIGNVNARMGIARACLAFLAGGVSLALRLTAAAAFVPMGILLALRYRSNLETLRYLFLPCAIFGLAGLGLGLITDHYFFGFWTIPFLGNFHFNVILDRAGLYGTHSRHWYFSTGFPALTGLLLPLLLISLWRYGRGHLSYGERNLWTIALCYLGTLSFNGHKELRYIMPVLPVFCLLAGSRVRRLFVGSSGTASRGRILFSATVFCAANLIAVLYLGLFHQTGPILVNRSIVSSAQATAKTSNESTFQIHYLTGACHSTPLHSQLHSPPLVFHTWALDCSPDCRADPDLVCETEQFSQDPVGFVGQHYFPCVGADDEEEEQTCLVESQPRSFPDYVVTTSTFAASIREQLESMGLQEVARFPHHLNGAMFNNDVILGSDYKDTAYRHIELTGWLQVSLEEMILFSRYYN